MKYQFPVRFHPQPWVGFVLDYNKQMTEFLHNLAVAAWDRQTHTWWVPEGSEGIVRAGALGLGVLSETANATWLQTLNSRSRLTMIGNEPTDAEYLSLGLKPGAPLQLVQIAYDFWMKSLLSAGGTAEKLYEVQQAFDSIKRKAGLT